MAFNRTDPAQLAALTAELTNDPVSMGYAGMAPTTVAILMNTVASNVAPQTGPDFVTASKLLKAIYPEAISSQDQFKLQLVFEISGGGSADMSEFKSEVSGLSGAMATAVNSIQRDLSRSEVLFSGLDDNGVTERTSISKNDVLATGV